MKTGRRDLLAPLAVGRAARAGTDPDPADATRRHVEAEAGRAAPEVAGDGGEAQARAEDRREETLGRVAALMTRRGLRGAIVGDHLHVLVPDGEPDDREGGWRPETVPLDRIAGPDAGAAPAATATAMHGV